MRPISPLLSQHLRIASGALLLVALGLVVGLITDGAVLSSIAAFLVVIGLGCLSRVALASESFSVAPTGRRIDLAGYNLTYADLSGADLRHTNLAGADLSHANLEGATLQQVRLANARIDDSELASSQLVNDPAFLLGGFVATQQRQVAARSKRRFDPANDADADDYVPPDSRRRVERSVLKVFREARMMSADQRGHVLDVASDGSGVGLRFSDSHSAVVSPDQDLRFAIEGTPFTGRVAQVDRQQQWCRVGLELSDVEQRLELLRVVQMGQA